MAIAVPASRGRIPVTAAERLAAARGGLVSAFVTRESRGQDQRCPWDLVSLSGQTAIERAAVAWLVAEAVMRQRCGPSDKAFQTWRTATLAGASLTGLDRDLVLAFASPVFKPQGNPSGEPSHGVPGHVGEWLWYLLALEQPDLPERAREYLAEPKDTVTDSGGDGLVIYRVPQAPGPEFLFRLWEMKKYTGQDNSVTDTVRGAWDQLAEHGARYVISQTAWAYKHVSPEAENFVSQLAELWLTGHPSSGAGVSVATNSSAVPQRRAFDRSHERIPKLPHDGQLEGLIIAVDNFTDFATHVQELVWTAL
ncbi:hypothetical protein OHT68_48770 (plasmid) [Streptomyces canus]|uniref:hypothetical protein n=1 Tax=Streptomyces canus TaxID=58343 RepID=UPI002E2B5F64|nr:hypothetical protein [Streptomyces canus]